ncbi:MAG: YqaE/Pmp3 family membrane protein [Crocinitomicaceae bacterium]|nr:YqaE/Pmp3 family membrane protein [Crocinitomicaceae bacterium]
MKKLLLAVLVVGFAISSCSIEKRLHQKGFNVEWNKNLGSLKKDKKQKQDFVTSEVAEEIAVVSPKTIKAPSVNNNNSISVDGVTLSESNETSVLVEENTYNEVNSQESEAINTTKIEKVNKAIRATKASGSKEEAIDNKTIASTKIVKKALKDDVPTGLLYVLCFFIPWVAVGLATDWDVKTIVYNILWTLLCGIPGIIHAIIIVGRNS